MFSVFKLFFRKLKRPLWDVLSFHLSENNWKNPDSLTFDTLKAFITSGHPEANHQLRFVEMTPTFTPRFALDPDQDNFLPTLPQFHLQSCCCRHCIKVCHDLERPMTKWMEEYCHIIGTKAY